MVAGWTAAGIITWVLIRRGGTGIGTDLLDDAVGWAFLTNFPVDKRWRYYVYTMGAITLVMFFCRFFLFHLFESPKVCASLLYIGSGLISSVSAFAWPSGRGRRHRPRTGVQEQAEDLVDRGDIG